MDVDKNDRQGIVLNGTLHRLTPANSAAVDCALKQVGGINNLVLTIETN